MASLRYSIKSGTNKIYLLVSTGRKENGGFILRKSINQVIENPKNWNSKKQEIKISPQEPNAQKVNTYISEHRTQVLKGIQEIEKKEEGVLIQKNDVLKIIDSINGSVSKVREIKKFSFTSHLEDFIIAIKSGKIKKKSPKMPYEKNTIKSYVTLLGKIKQFESELYQLTQSNISLQFQEDFIEWHSDFENSYTDKILDKFCSFVDNYLIGRLLLKFPKYNPKMWSNQTHSESLKTYLTFPELHKLLNLDISSKPQEWHNVRDTYCFNAFTCGMRVNDLKKLTNDNIHTRLIRGEQRKVLIFTQNKTNEPVITPIPEPALKIIDKHNGIPKIDSEQKSNEILKKLSKMAGFTEYVYSKDSKKKQRKYELITNHSARRSYCTNAWEIGMDLLTIMANSGHKTPDILLNYIDRKLEKMVEKTYDSKYFKFVDNLDESLKMQAV